MKRIPLFLIGILFIFLFMPCYGENVGNNLNTDAAIEGGHVTGEILVDFKDNISPSEIENFKAKYHLNLQFNSEYSKKELLMKAAIDETQLNSTVDLLSKDPDVEYVEPDYIYSAYSFTPNDPLYRYQWDMDQINVRGAWDVTAGENVIVAVIDTGVAYTNYDKFHRAEDLENTKFVQGYDFVNDNTYACDDNCHGTHVAGTIAQSTYNGKGVVGIAYNATIMPLKVLNSQGFGSVADIADAIRYAADHGAKVINMSLGGPFPSKIMADACHYAFNKGVTIVCAAGNSSSTRIGYPAGYPECIAVSAVRYDKEITFYSNKGKDIDIAAPGGDLRVDQNGDGKKDGILQNTIGRMDPSTDDYYLFQGTSMAAPHVAGVAAMIISMGITNPYAVEQILKDSANKDVPKPLDSGYGAGIVDANKAVLHAGLLRGYARLLLALLLLAGFLFIIKHRLQTSISISPLFFVGSIIGSCGLFFLLFFGISLPAPIKEFLCFGFPQWDMAIFGVSSHQHPLFYSAFFPLLLSAMFCWNGICRKFFIGFNVGVAAHLLYAALSSDSSMILIPTGLGRIWLLLSVAFCIYMAWYLAVKRTQKKEA